MQQPPQPQPIVPKGPIITLRYGGAPPAPHPPCTDPTPDEEFHRQEYLRQQMLAQKDAERQAKHAQEEQKTGGSAFFKVAKLASSVAAVVEKTAGDIHSKSEEKIRQLNYQRNQERFQTEFADLAMAGDVLACAYTCKVMHQGQRITGDILITNRNVCFVSDSLREVMPLQEIASVQKSLALDTLDNGPPFIMPIPAPNVLCDCLQIFTVRQQLFQFLSFESTLAKVGAAMTTTIKGRAVDRAYNFLDHTWRAAVQVPLPGVQYAQY